MAVQLTIPYETLVELVEQLPEAQRGDLLNRLTQHQPGQPTSAAQRLAAYHSSIDHTPLHEEPSIRREDWYDDDGR